MTYLELIDLARRLPRDDCRYGGSSILWLNCTNANGGVGVLTPPNGNARFIPCPTGFEEHRSPEGLAIRCLLP